MDYRCIADNGIPPRDTRTKRLIPSSNSQIFAYSRGQLSKKTTTPELNLFVFFLNTQ